MHCKIMEEIQLRQILQLGFKEDERDYRVVGYIFEKFRNKKIKTNYK